MSSPESNDPLAITRDHRRQWRDCLYVYPVISRRAHGVSVGVNLSIDQRCNYACAYCQIDRSHPRPTCEVDPIRLGDELRLALDAIVTGDIWNELRFASTPDDMRRINDIALSGDGEPTRCEHFPAVIDAAAAARRAFALDALKIVVITNATCLQSPQVLTALPTLQANNGVFWVKLDTGTETYYRRVNRPAGDMTLDTICENIQSVATQMPVVVQSLFFRDNGVPPQDSEIDAYIMRVQGILDGGGQIQLLQVHTVARAPSESFVSYLPDAELDAIAARIQTAIPDIPLEVTYGSDVSPQ
jgi:wyosine [tRNA(Phe)-imidazoG37] synthetase (radical SAM superfamily)